MGLFGKRKVFSRGKTLYLPGMLTKKKLRHVVAATKQVLRQCAIQYIELDDFLTAGFSAWCAGYERDFTDLVERNKALLERHDVRMIVTNDPHEALVLRERYGVKALHIVELLAEKLERITKLPGVRANYHHPCFLTKMGVEPKVALRVLRRAGVLIPSENPSLRCCGAVGDDFARNNPAVARKIARNRAKEFNEKIVVTCCPYCYMMLKTEKVKVKDITEMLAEV